MPTLVKQTIEARTRELSRCLEPAEQLRAVGWFQSGGNLTEFPRATFFTIRNWSVGITDRRVILAKLSRLNGELLQGAIFSVARENVLAKGHHLRVTNPDRKVPKRLRAIPASGYVKDEFEKALSTL